MRNTRILTDEELKYFARYRFQYLNGFVTVRRMPHNSTCLHIADKKFSINSPKRKITITPQAIDLWHNEFENYYSLIEVQNAINMLTIAHQPIVKKDVENILIKKSDFKIKEI